ncbi:MAG: DUF6624 domain-containing protein [Cyclobacteriaceae bacterium]
MAKPGLNLSVLRKYLPLLFILCIGCDKKPDFSKEALAAELDSIMIADQQYRSQMQFVLNKHGGDSPEMIGLWKKQVEIDHTNLERVIEIIDMVDGYPGKSVVGYSSSSVAFYVLQHAPDSVQSQYYELIIKAAEKNELDKRLAAMYRDRYLMQRGEPQIYGTQLQFSTKTDSLTGEVTRKSIVWPIADTVNIDSMRLWNGLGPLEDYLNRFGISRWE